MLHQEAIWIGRVVTCLSNAKTKILNLGSSTELARTVQQPHMEDFIFKPLHNIGAEVLHCDIIQDPGVDLVGDLTNEEFVEQLKEMNFDIVLCCNLLEHLLDRSLLLKSIDKIVPKSGYLLVTVPYHYPYHYDPIDTMFRPSVEELVNYFPGFECVDGKLLSASRIQQMEDGTQKYQRNYAQMLKDNPQLTILLIIRLLFPFYKPKIWWYTFTHLVMMFRPFQATCILLKKLY